MMGYRCVRAGKETMVVPDTPPPPHTHADKFMNLGRKANGGSKHTHIRPRYDGSGERGCRRREGPKTGSCAGISRGGWFMGNGRIVTESYALF